MRTLHHALFCQSHSDIIVAMKRLALKKNKSSLRKQKQQASSKATAMRILIARQKKLLLSLAGIGASGFADISVEHDVHLSE